MFFTLKKIIIEAVTKDYEFIGDLDYKIRWYSIIRSFFVLAMTLGFSAFFTFFITEESVRNAFVRALLFLFFAIVQGLICGAVFKMISPDAEIEVSMNELFMKKTIEEKNKLLADWKYICSKSKLILGILLIVLVGNLIHDFMEHKKFLIDIKTSFNLVSIIIPGIVVTIMKIDYGNILINELNKIELKKTELN